ncbi:MAG TPA: PEGA domain-containing protein [Anaeromyxobacteraceae bacterium]|nr:PEGA domain-containing protein [Anaeromyxobacteraceae bacterium]
MRYMPAAVAAALLVTLVPAPSLAASKAAQADDAKTAEAKAHFRQGVTYYKEARYREAISEFQAAYKIKPSGVLHYNIGQAYEKLGDIPAALNAYNDYLREVPKAQNRETVQRVIANLQARLAASGVQMLYVTSDPSDAEVWIDGQLRGRSPFNAALPQGSHVVSVTKSGYRTVSREVILSPERSHEVGLSLQAAPPGVAVPAAQPPVVQPTTPPNLTPAPPPPPPVATASTQAPAKVERKNWLGPIIAGSVAVVAAGAGIWMGIEAQNAQNSLLHGYPSSPSAANSLAQKAKNNATTANVLYGVAGVAALTGGGILVFGGYF